MTTYMLIFTGALIFAVGSTPVVRKLGWRLGVIDQPNARKVHLKPIPRLGGLAIYAAFILALLIFEDRFRVPQLISILKGFNLKVQSHHPGALSVLMQNIGLGFMVGIASVFSVGIRKGRGVKEDRIDLSPPVDPDVPLATAESTYGRDTNAIQAAAAELDSAIEQVKLGDKITHTPDVGEQVILQEDDIKAITQGVMELNGLRIPGRPAPMPIAYHSPTYDDSSLDALFINLPVWAMPAVVTTENADMPYQVQLVVFLQQPRFVEYASGSPQLSAEVPEAYIRGVLSGMNPAMLHAAYYPALEPVMAHTGQSQRTYQWVLQNGARTWQDRPFPYSVDLLRAITQVMLLHEWSHGAVMHLSADELPADLPAAEREALERIQWSQYLNIALTTTELYSSAVYAKNVVKALSALKNNAARVDMYSSAVVNTYITYLGGDITIEQIDQLEKARHDLQTFMPALTAAGFSLKKDTAAEMIAVLEAIEEAHSINGQSPVAVRDKIPGNVQKVLAIEMFCDRFSMYLYENALKVEAYRRYTDKPLEIEQVNQLEEARRTSTEAFSRALKSMGISLDEDTAQGFIGVLEATESAHPYISALGDPQLLPNEREFFEDVLDVLRHFAAEGKLTYFTAEHHDTSAVINTTKAYLAEARAGIDDDDFSRWLAPLAAIINKVGLRFAPRAKEPVEVGVWDGPGEHTEATASSAESAIQDQELPEAPPVMEIEGSSNEPTQAVSVEEKATFSY